VNGRAAVLLLFEQPFVKMILRQKNTTFVLMFRPKTCNDLLTHECFMCKQISDYADHAEESRKYRDLRTMEDGNWITNSGKW
jgi:hypothetical protein